MWICQLYTLEGWDGYHLNLPSNHFPKQKMQTTLIWSGEPMIFFLSHASNVSSHPLFILELCFNTMIILLVHRWWGTWLIKGDVFRHCQILVCKSIISLLTMNPPSSRQGFCYLPRSNSGGTISWNLLMVRGHFLIASLLRKSLCVAFHRFIPTSY